MLGEDWKTDVSKPLDRAFVEGEVALSPTLVKGVDYATKGIKNQKIRSAVQQALNLGMKPGMAMRLAKTASPLGWAALGAEGAYNVAKASNVATLPTIKCTLSPRSPLNASIAFLTKA